MRKFVIPFLAVMLSLSIVACGGNSSSGNKDKTTQSDKKNKDKKIKKKLRMSLPEKRQMIINLSFIAGNVSVNGFMMDPYFSPTIQFYLIFSPPLQ